MILCKYWTMEAPETLLLASMLLSRLLKSRLKEPRLFATEEELFFDLRMLKKYPRNNSIALKL